MANELTAIAVEKARPDPLKRREIPDGKGLYLVVQPTGAKQWAFRYRRPGDGKPAKLSLGKVAKPDEEPITDGDNRRLTLLLARAHAAALRAELEAGRDPAGERRAVKVIEAEALRVRAENPFEKVALAFINKHARTTTKESSWLEAARLLGFKPDPKKPGNLIPREPPKAVSDRTPPFLGVAHIWQGRAVQDITKRDVKELLEAVRDGGAGYSSIQVQAHLSGLFRWLVEDEEVLTVSPMVGVKKVFRATERKRVLKDWELALIWRGAEAIGEPFGPFVKALILTGQRRDEVAKMRWSELDLEAGVWTLPSERAKNSEEHIVPLSDEAMAILSRISPVAGKPDYVFTSGSRGGAPLAPVSGYSRAKNRLDAAMLSIMRSDAAKAGSSPEEVEPVADWRFHDLRRTMATGLQRLRHPLQVTEAILNHKSGSIRGVAKVYHLHDYSDEKRQALAEWGAHVASLTAPPREPAVEPGNVVPIKAARA